MRVTILIALFWLATWPINAAEIISDATGHPFEMPICAAASGYLAQAPKERREAAVKECVAQEAKKSPPINIDPVGSARPSPLNPFNPWASDEERRHRETLRAIEALENAVRDQTIILDLHP